MAAVLFALGALFWGMALHLLSKAPKPRPVRWGRKA